MSGAALASVGAYSQFIGDVVSHHLVMRSTLTIWPTSPFTGVMEGEVYFINGYRLRLREELDFDEQLIASYGYEVYRDSEKLYWYDDFPHPNDPTLASTHPHHKHVPPDIKHHRIPAPGFSFLQPNLPLLIAELESLLMQPD